MYMVIIIIKKFFMIIRSYIAAWDLLRGHLPEFVGGDAGNKRGSPHEQLQARDAAKRGRAAHYLKNRRPLPPPF